MPYTPQITNHLRNSKPLDYSKPHIEEAYYAQFEYWPRFERVLPLAGQVWARMKRVRVRHVRLGWT